MTDLVSPQLMTAMKHWYVNGDRLIIDCEQRLKKAAKEWGVTGLVPLEGGGYSLVCSGWRNGVEVVVKANLKPEDAFYEKIGLQALQTGNLLPRVIEYCEGVLLLEKLSGETPLKAAGTTIAGVLVKLHARKRLPSVFSQYPVENLPTWQDRGEEFFYSYARRCYRKTTKLNSLLNRAEKYLPKLLGRDVTVIHGDVLRKNILQNASGVFHLIDPLTTVSPLGWEFAHSACSIQAQGGNGDAVVEAGLSLGVENLEKWLVVASIHHALDKNDIVNIERLENLRNLIQKHN